MPSSSLVRVACIQMEPRFGDTATNVAHSVELIERAADGGAKLIVLPELANTGYVFETREEAFALAETIPGGPTCDRLERDRGAPRPAHRRRHHRARRRRAL